MKKLSLMLTLISLVPVASHGSLDALFTDEIDEALNSFKAMEESLEKVAQSMQKKFEHAFNPAKENSWSYDIQPKDDVVVIKCTIPGIDPKELKPEIEHDVLQIALKLKEGRLNIAISRNMVEFSSHSEIVIEKTKEGKEPIKQSKISSQSFAESIPSVIINEVQVELDNDQLTITLPRKHKKTRTIVPVSIKTKQDKTA